jgi:hypothetical protein
MRKAEAETILAAELAAVNGGPLARVADGTLSFGEWMRNFYIPMRGANWRPATRRSNEGYLKKQIYPRIEHVWLKDISKFQVQMLLNQLATVVALERDKRVRIIKKGVYAALVNRYGRI